MINNIPRILITFLIFILIASCKKKKGDSDKTPVTPTGASNSQFYFYANLNNGQSILLESFKNTCLDSIVRNGWSLSIGYERSVKLSVMMSAGSNRKASINIILTFLYHDVTTDNVYDKFLVNVPVPYRFETSLPEGVYIVYTDENGNVWRSDTKILTISNPNSSSYFIISSKYKSTTQHECVVSGKFNAVLYTIKSNNEPDSLNLTDGEYRLKFSYSNSN